MTNLSLTAKKKYIKQLRIADIASLYITVFYQDKIQSNAKCPFCGHGKTHFYLYNDTNYFQCFACDSHGDIIELIARLFNLSFKNAILKIYNDISQPKATKHLKKINSQYSSKPKPLKKGLVKECPASLLYTDLAIITFLKVVSLSNNDRQYLKRQRNLSDEEIDKLQFFSFPTCTKTFLQRLETEAQKSFLSNNIFKYMPGMYTLPNLKTNNVDSAGEPIYHFIFKPIKGIGIPIHNTMGAYVGIQIKVFDKRYHSKYLWFSSNSKNLPIDGYLGTPASTLIAAFNNPKSSTLNITEGYFKGYNIYRITKENVWALSGVNAIKSLKDYWQALPQNTTIRHINIIFDSDISQNLLVMKALNKLIIDIQKLTNLQPRVILWNAKFGKGIDDVLNNYYPHIRGIFHSIPASMFQQRFCYLLTHLQVQDFIDKKHRNKLLSNRKFNYLFNLNG